jgi:archaemetzincin
LNAFLQHSIILSPIGECDGELLDPLRRVIQKVFGFQVEIASLLSNVDFAFDTKRRQYHSTPILALLAELAPPHAIRILSLTTVDLFIPILTHVYGEAQLGGRASIVSTYRLREGLPALDTEGAYRYRVTKEAVHELGHTFNLRHCKDPTCIMHYCRSVLDVDRKSDALCRYCKILLDDELERLASMNPPAL